MHETAAQPPYAADFASLRFAKGLTPTVIPRKKQMVRTSNEPMQMPF
jgi:hypothetical protein